MTREEAKTILVGKINPCLNGTDWKDAVDMAIKALEQQTTSFEWCTDCKEYDQEKHCCHRWSKVIRNTVEEMKQEPCEDCISRQEVLDVIEREQFKGDAISEIEKLPPVQPKPKTGHWIHLKHNKGKCSECHDVVLIAQMYRNANYCPNCGAKMVEPQESEETDD